jgi:tartrate dehydratase alpha subunit/fumarate hydratase class I-like protein
MTHASIQAGLRALIREASTSLPPDIEAALTAALLGEGSDGARGVLDTIGASAPRSARTPASRRSSSGSPRGPPCGGCEPQRRTR